MSDPSVIVQQPASGQPATIVLGIPGPPGPGGGAAGGALGGTYPNPTLSLTGNAGVTGVLPVANQASQTSTGTGLSRVVAGVAAAALALGTSHQPVRVNQAGTAFECAALVQGECTLEQFGADGTPAGNQTALTAAQAALVAGTFKTLKLTAMYPIAGAGGFGITLPAGRNIYGQGDSTGFSTTANITVVQLTAATGASLRDFLITGNTTDGSGGDASRTLQFGVACGSGAAMDGQFIAQFSNVNIDNCYRGFSFDNQPGASPVLASQQITNCRARYCIYNFYVTNHCEYLSFTGCQSIGIGIATATASRGLYIGAGNLSWTGGSIQQNWRGIELQGGVNAGHGVITGINCNHNATSVYANGVNLGFQFIGGNFYEGNMQFVNCTQFITFIGGQIDPTYWIFDGSMVRFMDVELPMAYFAGCIDNANNNPSTVQWWRCRANVGTDPPAFVQQRVQPQFYFAADASQTLTLQESEAEYIDVQPRIHAPGTLSLTGSWGRNFPGTQWNGNPSTGASGGRTLIATVGAVPTVGAAVKNQNGNPLKTNGINGAGGNDAYTALAASSYLALAAWTIVWVGSCTTAQAATSGTGYLDPNLVCDQGAVIGIAWAVKGGITGVYGYINGTQTAAVACAAGTTIRTVEFHYDGVNIWIVVDGVASANVAAANPVAFGNAIVLHANYNRSVRVAAECSALEFNNANISAANMLTLRDHYFLLYGAAAGSGANPAAISAGRTLTSAKAPIPGLRNGLRNQTAQIVTYAYSSGAGVAVAAAGKALISADLTNAFNMAA